MYMIIYFKKTHMYIVGYLCCTLILCHCLAHMQGPSTKQWFAAQGLSIRDPDEVFTLLDADRSDALMAGLWPLGKPKNVYLPFGDVTTHFAVILGMV